jgi:hypothetical protein
MSATEAATRIQTLLDALKADFPRLKEELEQRMKGYGIEESFSLEVEPAQAVQTIPTFKPGRDQQVSPMLKARYDYAGAWKWAGDFWLGVNDMPRRMRSRSVKSYHRALRENWEGSAPMLFPDERLSLFAINEGVPDNLTYIVWGESKAEPELWRYASLDSWRFKDLSEFLTWCLQGQEGARP